MEKHNVYMVQAAYLNGKAAYLPYAAGVLIACAWQNAVVSENYEAVEIICLREDIDSVVNRLEKPFYVGFSSYVWNHEYNKALAKKIKEKYPDCYIQFGGHNVAPGGALLEECPFIDFVIHNEGEEAFTLLLKALADGKSPDGILNLSFRKNGTVINEPCVVPLREDYPSPYLTGVFDKLMAAHPDFDFLPLLETNRGCPYKCAYCGWGLYKSKIRMFPMDRIKKELKWVSDHKCEYFGFADANFGMFERDAEIVDEIIRLKKETGYPKKFQTSYAKNSTERIFEMTKKLNENGLDKGVTLSFQSLSDEVLENIYRSNIGIDYYKKLMSLYNEAGIPTYSELILGLPGETYETFENAVNTLLCAGQHSSLYIHMLEWFPCTALAEKDYMERFGMEYTVIPLNQPHKIQNREDAVCEYSKIITKTTTMSNDDWVRMNLFAECVQCFHHYGLLLYFALFCCFSLGIRYSEFYSGLVEYLRQHPDTVAGATVCNIEKRLTDIVKYGGSAVVQNEKYGEVSWMLEEYMFLETVSEKKRFYEEIIDYLKRYDIPEDIFEDILRYQKGVVKTVDEIPEEIMLSYDLPSYFGSLLKNIAAVPQKRKTNIKICDQTVFSDWADYARYIVWYGRKNGSTFYEIKTEYFD